MDRATETEGELTTSIVYLNQIGIENDNMIGVGCVTYIINHSEHYAIDSLPLGTDRIVM